MFAVIKTGGKQYKVAKNDVIRVERLAGEAGDTVELGEVLMVGDGGDVTVGAPVVAGAAVAATVVDQIRDDKIIVFKKKRRKNYRRKNGHRQHLTVLRVTDILTEGRKPEPAAAEAAPATDEAAAAKPAERRTRTAARKAATAKTQKNEE